jgi:hypothetical protein
MPTKTKKKTQEHEHEHAARADRITDMDPWKKKKGAVCFDVRITN